MDFATLPATSLAEAGWRTLVDDGVSEVRLHEGSLLADFAFKPYRGTTIAHAVPAYADADLRMSATLGRAEQGHDNFSFCLDYLGLRISSNNYGAHKLMRLWDGKWAVITDRLPRATRCDLRVVFTPAADGLVEYYLDDMESPCFAEEGVFLKLPADGAATTLTIGNYGLSRGKVLHRVHRLSLGRATAGAATAGAVRAERAQVFQGIAFGRCQAAVLARRLGATAVTEYVVTNNAPALGVENVFRLDRLPPLAVQGIPGHLIMADFPLNTHNLQPISLRALARSVEQGAHLVVLGGMFTLNKGGMAGTPIAGLLPVDVADPWAVVRSPGIEILPGGMLTWRHALPVRAGAQVIDAAGGQPLWVTWRRGAGRATVFLGMPYGSDSAGYWAQPGWIDYATAMVRKGASGE
ncbi:MAG: hypothetical protein L6R48_01870 [Planctomycetes bacterium]|nr:hypothetical protein [Planctomycetota bacterium]